MSSKKTLLYIIRLAVLFLLSQQANATKTNTRIHDQNKKNIWLHAAQANDVTAIQKLTDHIKKHLPDIEFFISTITPEIKKAADQTLTRADNVKVIPCDNLQKLAHSISSINPKAIIFVHHEFLPNLMLLANLNSIPTYLIGAQYAHKTERLLITAPDLYIPLLNTCKHIFTQTEDDTRNLQEAGILSPEITTGDPLQENILIPDKLDVFLRALEQDINK